MSKKTTIYDFKVTEHGKLLVHRKGTKRIMVLDGYEKRCFLQLLERSVDLVGREFALDNIWRALSLRADAQRREYRTGSK